MARALAAARAENELLRRRLVDRQTFDQAILDGVDLGIVITDPQGRVSFVNRTASELLDVGAEATGADVTALLGLDAPPSALLLDAPRRVLAASLTTAHGQLDLELSVSRAEGAVDQRLGFYFIFRDVREDKAREEERRRFERLAAMGTMVAGFAHEVRNPIAALRSLAESLAEEMPDGALALPHVTRMLQVLGRMERLVRTSLQFGRPAPPRRAPHDPASILALAVSELAPRTQASGGELRLEVDPDLPEVFVDEGQIAQVLIVLLNNAIDATGSARRVTVRVLGPRAPESQGVRRSSQPPPPPAVRYEVVDDGPGIPPDLVGRIFDPFFTTKPSGTGLGLSIAQQIVSENGARLELASTREQTTFAVVLPTVA